MKRASLWRSFGHALTGLWNAARGERNLRIHFTAAVFVLLLAAWLRVGLRDWAILLLTIGAVIAAELVNTSLEAIVDLVSPEQQESAKLAKDVAAAAVLVLAIVAGAVGLLILGPPLLLQIR